MKHHLLCLVLGSCLAAPALPQESPITSADEYASIEATFPFHADIEACIKQDALGRGIGLPCVDAALAHCPDQWVKSSANHFASCNAYATAYWNKRMADDVSTLIAHYTDADRDKSETEHRAPQLKAAQDIWRKWRKAKCDFVYKGQSYYPWIHVEVETCTYDMTARRALEVAALRRLVVD